jgi:hypothetical protein
MNPADWAVSGSRTVRFDRRELAGETDPAPHRERLGDDVAAEHAGPAGRRAQQRGQDPHERRLARAVGAEQAEDGAGLDREIEAVEGDDVSEVVAHALGEDGGGPG